MPGLVFVCSLIALGLAAFLGTFARRWRHLQADEQPEFSVIQTTTLTLLGLIVGFSFSMAINRYDQRKTLEESEANAIGTEFVRADLMPVELAGPARLALKKYLDRRIAFYTTSDAAALTAIDVETARSQTELWSLARAAATQQPSPISALVVSGMNDVLNAQGYVQAAWWNRIPAAAWILMAAIAIGCNLLLGYGAPRVNVALMIVVPLTISVSFLLIADIDSARGGVIRVAPQNLIYLAQSLASQ